MGDKAERTREKIRQAAYSLFAEKGFKEVTMTAICEQTGLSRGGLYRYYTGTGEIFSEILSQEYRISHRIAQGERATDILEDMLNEIRQEILERERSLSLAIYEYASLGNEELFVRLNDNAKSRWKSLIAYGMREGEFNEVDPDQASELILYYYQGLRMWSRVIPLNTREAENYVNSIRQMLCKNKD